MRFLLILVLASNLYGLDWHKFRRVSQIALILANSADIASSFQYPEANPVLRDRRTGLLLHKGVAIKAGVLAGLLIGQETLGKNHPKTVSWINLGAAAVIGGVAARNFKISKFPVDRIPSQK